MTLSLWIGPVQIAAHGTNWTTLISTLAAGTLRGTALIREAGDYELMIYRDAPISAVAVAYSLTLDGAALHPELPPPPLPAEGSPGVDAFTKVFGYDANGNLRLARVGGVVQEFEHDALGRLVADAIVTPQGPSTARTSYGLDDMVSDVHDTGAAVTNFLVDVLGRVTQEISPDRGLVRREFDARGNLRLLTDARGHQLRFDYDGDGELLSVSADGVERLAYEVGGIDPVTGAPVPNGAHRVTAITSPAGLTALRYDGFGRLTSRTLTTDTDASCPTTSGGTTPCVKTDTFAVRYGWGADGVASGKLTSVRYPSGVRVDYGFGANGAIASIGVVPPTADGAGNDVAATIPVVGARGVGPSGELRRWTWGDGSAYERTYLTSGPQLGRLATYPLGAITRSVTFDRRGLITELRHTGAAGATALDRTYAYDERAQLRGVTSAADASGHVRTYRYDYDASGNRTRFDRDGTVLQASDTPGSHRIDATQTLTGGAVSPLAMQLDASGNPTLLGELEATYDAAGRWSQVDSAGGGRVVFAYDQRGDRVKEVGASVPGGRLQRVYDEDGHLLGEYAAGVPLYEVVWLGDLPVAVVRFAAAVSPVAAILAVDYVFVDHLNTPRVIVRANDHALLWRWDGLDAFGSDEPDADPSGLGRYVFNLRFPGQVYSAATGYVDNHNRDYAPALGRYLQADPFGTAGGLNTYAYVGNNPVMSVDPAGLSLFDEVDPLGNAVGAGPFPGVTDAIARGISKVQPFVDDFLPVTRTNDLLTGRRSLDLEDALEVAGAIPAVKLGGKAAAVCKSYVDMSPYAKRLAEKLAGHAANDVEKLLRMLREGNLRSGKGFRALGDGFLELRGANLGRVIVKETADGFDIIATWQTHQGGKGADGATINRLIQEYKDAKVKQAAEEAAKKAQARP